MKKFVLGGVALAAMLATPAMAADMPVKARPVPPPVCYDWSGFYGGAHVGWLWAETEWVHPDEFHHESHHFRRGHAISGDIDAPFGGLHAGVQGQFGCGPWGAFVFGVEVAWSVTDDQRDFFDHPRFRFLEYGRGLRAYSHIEEFTTAGVRVGWAWDTWLFTVSGGWAGASVITGLRDIRANTETVPDIFFHFQDTHFHTGWYFGAAVEKMVAKGPFVDAIFGLEYQFISLDAKRHCEVITVAHCFANPHPVIDMVTTSESSIDLLKLNRRDVDAVAHTIRARLTIKTPGFGFLFGGPAVP